MTLHFSVPFAQIKINNALPEHKSFFEKIYFHQTYDTPSFLSVEINCRSLANLKTRESLRCGNMSLVGNQCLLFDTKGLAALVLFKPNSSKIIQLSVEPGFDLYYLFTFLIEPLIIIFSSYEQVLYVHSSSISHNGNGHLMPAWRHTGKTKTVLQYLAKGASFIGDDYTVLYKNQVYSYPKNINIFSYNFLANPELYTAVSFATKLRLQLMMQFKELLENFASNTSGAVSKVFVRIAQLAEVATNVTINPHKIGSVVNGARFKSITMLVSSAKRKSAAKKLKAEVVARMMTTTIKYELSDFYSLYSQFCYLTQTQNNQIDRFELTYFKLARKIIAKIPARMVCTSQSSQ